MQDDRYPAQRAIEVESDPPDEPGFAARVRLVGEHDLATPRQCASHWHRLTATCSST